ncbi:tetraspanin-11-like [Mangifera indica]|uniref:tetraspanin-11-like n=1 Tax=Mangifera indica TaxID=29780 RepID=UPI001CF9B738|nr:tetraspanin-11-like [Mangifera indica]
MKAVRSYKSANLAIGGCWKYIVGGQAKLGFVAIACAAYVQFHGGTTCQKALEVPLLITGLVLLVVSLLGLIGSFCRATGVLFLYLLIMFLLIIGLLVFTIFVLVVTNKVVGQSVSPSRLQDYSKWLQNQVDGGNWEQIKGCLIDAKVCNDINEKHWSLTQSGCCKPPMYCGLIHRNSTFWVMPEGGPGVPDSDCTTFSNHRQTLCYDCKSCKAGVLAQVRREWRALGVFNVCVLAIVIMKFSLGCCLRRKYIHDHEYVRYSPYY